MALIVEDGTGLINSESFVSVADFKTYQDGVGNDYSAKTDAQIEEALRRATAHLSNGYSWQAYRTHGRDQALAWPRTGVIDREGYGIDNDEMPSELIDATCELGWRELSEPNSLNPDFVSSELVKMEKVGELQVEYAVASTGSTATTPVVQVVNDMIGQFLKSGSGNRLAGSSYRV